MIYIFDKTQAIIKVLTNDDFTAAHLNFKINTATTFEFSLPANKALPSGSKYVATPHPLNDSKFIMLRLTERVDNTETIDYSAYELAYQELATDGYIEDKRPQNQSALNLMKIALDGSNWELNNVNISGIATTNFYYIDRLSAISKVVDLLGGEIVFYIEIQGNAISGRYMDYLARQGADTSKVFASGSNLLTVERQSDTSGIYTAILPRGKGKEIDNGDADTPDGYGRRINIADVEWKKSSGNPLDKPKGSIVLSDPDATAEWGQINGNARLLLQTYDDIDDVNVLISSAYKTLQSVNHPQIQYSATVADVGGLSLGDTVLIMHGDRDLSYKTRVFEVKYDLLSPDQTELSLGDDLSSNSITSQINNLNAVADTNSSQTQWTINQIGRPGTTYGATAPDSPKVGDIWFKYLPDGGTEIYRWNGDIWELLASPTTADDIADAVTDAVTQAKAHTDEVKQGLSSDIESARSQAVSLANAAASQAYAHTDEVKQGLSSDIATAKSQAASLASTAEANAKSAATSQFNQAQNALSDAKTDLTKSIADEASQALSAANSQAQGYVNQAKSDINDTINALSVGGRNYVLNSSGLNASASSQPTLIGATSSNAGSALSYGTDGITMTNDTGDTDHEWYYQIATSWQDITKTPLSDGNYMISVDVMGTANQVILRYGQKSSQSSDLFQAFTINNTTWTRISMPIVFAPNTTTFYIRINGGANGSISGTGIFTGTEIIKFRNVKIESGNKATDWTPAPEDVVLDYTTKDSEIKETITQYQETNDGKVSKAQTTAQAAVDGLKFKVSQTEYDQKTGDLSTKINDVKETADGSKQTIADIQEADGKRDAKIAEIESTASGLKSTFSDFSTEQGKQSGYISDLQQTAKGFEGNIRDINNTVNGLGQVNQLMNTEFSPDYEGWVINSPRGIYRLKNNMNYNGSTIFEFDARDHGGVAEKGSVSLISNEIPINYGSKISLGVVARTIFEPADGTTSYFVAQVRFTLSDGTTTFNGTAIRFAVGDNNTSFVYGKSENIEIPNNAVSVAFYSWVRGLGTVVRLSQPMIVFESTVGQYVQGNYNNNGALAKVKLTADEASAAVTKLTNADGIITKAQADIKANADAISQKVSKTVYDQKTGDLTQAVAKAQTTADGAVSTVGNYKTSNDGRVKAAESKIEQNSNDITARVTKTDYDNDQHNLSTSLAQWKADYDGFTGTVSDLQTDFSGMSYENRNLLENSGFEFPISNITGAFSVVDNSNTTMPKPFDTKMGLVDNVSSQVADDLWGWYPLSQPVTLKADVTYTLSYYFSVAGKAGYQHSDYGVDDSGNFIKGIMAEHETPDTTGGQMVWKRYSKTFTLTTDTILAGLRFGFVSNVDGRGWKVVDNVKLEVGSKATDYSVAPTDTTLSISQTSQKADSISNFVRDSSGNLSSTFQNALSRTSIITGSTLATSIQKQTTTQITSALTDNNGKIISLINQDSSGVQIAGKNIALDGNTTFTALAKTVNNLDIGGRNYFQIVSSVVGYIDSDGTINSTSSLGVKTSDFISVNVGDTWQLTYWPSDTTNRRMLYAMYDSSNNLVGSRMALDVPSDKDSATASLLIPSGVTKIRVGAQYMSDDSSKIKAELGTVATDWTPAPEDIDSAVSQVKNTADSLSSFVRDSNGNISSNFQTALSKTSLVSGSPFAMSIQEQTATRITSALTDNNKNIISLINQDTSGVQIAGKNIVLDGNTTVTGDFYAKGGNFTNLNASNITFGMLNGNQVNITNLNASNITTGNLTGVQIGITNGGKFYANQLGTIYDFSDNPYYYSNQSSGNKDPWIRINQNGVYNLGSDGTRLSISGTVTAADAYIGSTKQYAWYTQSDAGIQSGTNKLNTSAELGMTGLRISQEDADHPEQTGGYSFLTGHGMYVGYNQNNPRFSVNTTGTVYADVIKLISGRSWQSINSATTDLAKLQQGQDLQFYVGSSNTLNLYSNEGNVSLQASGRWLVEGRSNGYIYLGNVKWTSGGTSVQMASDGALTALSSSIKYKTNIEYDKDGAAGEKLLTLDPMTWQDKSDDEEIQKYKETGIKPDHKIDLSNRRYYGMLAEDFDKAGLDDFVLKDEETGELRGIQYEKIGAALIPIIRNMRKMILEQQVDIERLKEK